MNSTKYCLINVNIREWCCCYLTWNGWNHFSRFNIKGWEFPTIAALYVLLKRCLYVVIFPNPDQSIFLMLWDALLPLIYNEIFSVDLITQTFIYFLFLCIYLRTKNRGTISFRKTYIFTFNMCNFVILVLSIYIYSV